IVVNNVDLNVGLIWRLTGCPLINVFGEKDLDIDDCVARLVDAFSASSEESSLQAKTVVLRHDVAYTHKAGTLLQCFQEVFQPRGVQVMYSQVPEKIVPASPVQKQPLDESERISKPPVQDCTIFYIGDENLGLTNLIITHSSCNVVSYSPSQRTSQIESGRTNKMLMRRYAVVHKARDADVFGILVGTLGVAASRKKSYTISVGKLNPAKLANFMEIECFVLVACPENSLIDAKVCNQNQRGQPPMS
ncbi:hypothetical protein MPER_08911, partial [Moniliophthora perniciosa FA553]